MTAGVACGSCGTGLRENAKFCDGCGAPLARVGLIRRVQTGDGAVRRCRSVDGHRGGGGCGAVPRSCPSGGGRRWSCSARRDGEFIGDGVMACSARRWRWRITCSGVPGRAGHPGAGERLAAEVARRDGIELRVRVGLNSGRVIAGDIGSGSSGYAATGEPVGLAQRMESVAPPGGVLCRRPRCGWSSTPSCGRTGVGAHQGGRRRCPRAGCWGSASGMPWSGGRRRGWSAGAGSSRPWMPCGPHDRGRGGVVGVVGRRVSASPGWRGRPRRWRPVAGSRWSGPSASRTPVTFPSRW